jgi:hypothetical protein
MKLQDVWVHLNYYVLLLLGSETHQIYYVADALLREIALTRVSFSEQET